MSKLEFFTTEDGSPTAFFGNPSGENYQNEKMHHSGGAFGESVYIYGPAIQWGFARMDEPLILSLGTGLAYNEILAAAFSVIFDAPLKMQSFEANNELNQALIGWIGDLKEGMVPFKIYDSILSITAETFELSESDIKSKLLKSLEAGSWKINGAWDSNDTAKYNVVIYDFFSSKAMERFWGEEYLNDFLKNHTDNQCSFGTYACTGKLKRAFKSNGFTYFERRGYLWKRSSTFACRK